MTDRAIGRAKQVGDNLKFMVPSANALLAAGTKLGAAKTGVRVAGLFLRRHPAVTVATVAGAGLLWYAAKRRSARAEQGNTIIAGERSSRRIDASQSNDAQFNANGERDHSGRRNASAGARSRKRGGARGGARNDSTPNATQ
ncbi:hypothetical protein [Cognatilysobacter bugurensis]|nr:hypothetical protein [Lysobacter bugurensis]